MPKFKQKHFFSISKNLKCFFFCYKGLCTNIPRKVYGITDHNKCPSCENSEKEKKCFEKIILSQNTTTSLHHTMK